MLSDLQIQQMAVKDLVPAPYNPREITQEALSGLRHSVERFGCVEPIIWNKRTGNIVGGHQRLKVLQQMGEAETQVVVVDLDVAEEMALNVALNNPAIAGDFTPDLHKILAELKEIMPDTYDELLFDDLADMTSKLLAELAPDIGLIDPDDIPESPEEPVTQHGDLYVLGRHRLVCGDSRDPAVLMRLMDGKVASLFATDPPYGISYDGVNHPQNLRDKERGRTPGGQNRNWSADYQDLDAWDHFKDRSTFEKFLIDVFKTALPHLADNAAWYTWHASATVESFKKAWKEAGVRYHQTVVWIKPCFVLGFSAWNWQYEPCLLGWRKGNKPAMNIVPDEFSNVWTCDWEGASRCTDGVHPTQKPTRVFELPMMKHTRPGDICLETFAGSGSQVIAAERLDRRCFAVELNPRFVDVAVLRWEQFTGNIAERIPHGEVS